MGYLAGAGRGHDVHSVLASIRTPDKGANSAPYLCGGQRADSFPVPLAQGLSPGEDSGTPCQEELSKSSVCSMSSVVSFLFAGCGHDVHSIAELPSSTPPTTRHPTGPDTGVGPPGSILTAPKPPSLALARHVVLTQANLEQIPILKTHHITQAHCRQQAGPKRVQRGIEVVEIYGDLLGEGRD